MLRINMFKYFSESSIPGIIFTCVVNYDKLSDIENISIFKNIFESNGGKFYYVELNAPLDIRLNRNKTENRLFYKPEKQNIEFSEKQIFHAEKNHRNYSLENELNCQNYIKIDNSELSAIDTAKIIKEKFNLNWYINIFTKSIKIVIENLKFIVFYFFLIYNLLGIIF